MQKRDLRFCKKFFTALVIVLLCAKLFARRGMLWGEKNLLVSKTKWFDIIYPERCEASATILYEKADSVYEEITAQYGLTPAFRIPVVITPAVDQFNAFWTAVPYNHIAIYDTGVSGSSELAVFSETLLSTFRHELTHAVTYNMKDDLWRIAGKIYGDCFAPGMLTVTTGMAEGATVSCESAAGEGRLNDEYAKHYVKQAKIEDKFPSYHDVSGASDVSPGGSPYYFNGAFHQWLQEQYGLDAYAQFWFRVVNAKNFTIAGAFKKAFGVKLRTAWKQFEQDYEVPDVEANPVSAGIVRDFFEPDGNVYSMENDAGSLFDSLSVASLKPGATDEDSASRLVWLDHFGGRVFSSDLDISFATQSGSAPKTRQLFSMRGITGVRLSNDGRLVAVSYISENAPGATARVKIYDIERGSFYSVREAGLKEAGIVCSGDTYYLIAQKYEAQQYTVSISKICMSENGRRITAVEPAAQIVMPAETNPFAFTPLEDGSFAFVKKERMNYSVCVYSVEGEQLREFSFPEGMVVRSLSADGGLFVFSYAKNGTLPRLGFMDMESGEQWLSSEDISGGVFTPVLYKGTVVYVGEFYRQSRLLCMRDVAARGFDMEWAQRSAGALVKADAVADENSKNIASTLTSLPQQNNSIPSVPYSPFPYLLRGIFIPLSSYQTEYFGINADYTSNAGTSLWGITYITANPWTEGNSDLYVLTAGWNVISNAWGVDLQITKGTATSLLRSVTDVKTEFDLHGWKQSGGTISLGTNFNFGRFSTISLINSSKAFIGKQDSRFPEKYSNFESEDYKTLPEIAFWDKDTFGITAPENDTLYYMLQDIVSLKYSNIRRTGPGRFEYGGFSVGANFGARYDASLDEKNIEYMKATALGADLKICVPHILPFESSYGFTYNMPFRLSGSLFPSESIYGYTMPKTAPGRVVFDATAETTLFSMDFQLALPGITAVYLNDLYISAGYAGTAAAGRATEMGFQNVLLGNYFKSLYDGNGYYFDSIYFKSVLEFTPNIGLFARSSYKMGLVTTFSYVIHTPEHLRAGERIRITAGFDMNF